MPAPETRATPCCWRSCPGDDAAFRTLVAHLSADVVAAHFAPLVAGPVRRSVLPGLPAIVFVLPGVLGGGVTDGATLDGHGKTLSYHLLMLRLDLGQCDR
jgi:hypothetical protein